MEINLDLAAIGQNPFIAAWFVLKYLGIPVFCILFFFGGRILWLNWRRGKYSETLEYTLLAIDIPKANEQSPKAVENMFDQISGSHSSIDFVGKWWNGKFDPKFSLEIVSMDGYIQFLVWTEKKFRDLIEAAVYAQYHDAEITEVEDYAYLLPKSFPDEKYNLWGAEFIETNKDVYPIQTYPFFEHSLSQEFKDPMAALMEILGSLRKDENVWIQYVVTVTDTKWMKKSQAEIDKIVGRNTKTGAGFFGNIQDFFSGWISDTVDQLSGKYREGKTSDSSKDINMGVLSKLTPRELEMVKAIEAKEAKTGFIVKMRMIYFADRDIYSPARGVSAVAGAFRQFSGDFNGLKPESKFTKTREFLFFSKSRLVKRQRNIAAAYKERSNYLGVGDGFILNAEELATIYHFPSIDSVKITALKKVGSKKIEPPLDLPFKNAVLEKEDEKIKDVKNKKIDEEEISSEELEELIQKKKNGEPPNNLPIK
ncbi:MAG: hypothetical protein U9O66_01415 [Patescibacteria group bacterium]|nr:hypothetical protein [Patescibacteria group bacterium]